MKGRRYHTPDKAMRRMTLTLPADSLLQASRIARARNVTLSAVVSEALGKGLLPQIAAQRSKEVLRAYEKAFCGFSAADMLLLNGIVMDKELLLRESAKENVCEKKKLAGNKSH